MAILAVFLSLAASPVAAQVAEDLRDPGDWTPSREVTIRSGQVALSGLLRVPDAPAPYPAVVVLPGSVPTEKEDERLVAVADALVRRGFAALIMDSRGEGDSQGDFDTATFEVLAEDATAAIKFLRGRSDVMSDAVGIWGLSQGGTWVGPLAAESSNAAFLVAFSSPLVSPEEQTHQYLDARLRESGKLEEGAIEEVREFREDLWSYYATGRGRTALIAWLEDLRLERWFEASGLPEAVRTPSELDSLPPSFRTFLAQRDFDPVAAVEDLALPVLLLYEEGDPKLESGARERLRSLASGGRVSWKILSRSESGIPGTGARVGEGDEAGFDTAAKWLETRVGRSGARSR